MSSSFNYSVIFFSYLIFEFYNKVKNFTSSSDKSGCQISAIKIILVELPLCHALKKILIKLKYLLFDNNHNYYLYNNVYNVDNDDNVFIYNMMILIMI